jgi:hypothetical protein
VISLLLPAAMAGKWRSGDRGWNMIACAEGQAKSAAKHCQKVPFVQGIEQGWKCGAVDDLSLIIICWTPGF